MKSVALFLSVLSAALLLTSHIFAQASDFAGAPDSPIAAMDPELEALLNTYCFIQGPTNGSCGSPLVFTATSPIQPSVTFNATFTLLNNTAGASFVGPNSCNGVTSCNAVVTTSGNGSFLIRVNLTFAGNVIKTCQQTVGVTDSSPPVITCAPNATVPCGSPTDPSVTGTPTVTDCSPFTVQFSDAISGTNCAGNIITRTWTAIDSLGLSSSCTQTITPMATVSVTCAQAVSVQCFSQIPVPQTSSVVVTNACGGQVTVTHLGDVATNGTSSCNNVVTRTYQVVNGCGNSATCTQTFTVNDTTPPSIQCPAPVSVQCFSQVPPPNPGSVTASDNCGPVQVFFAGDVPSNGTSNCNNVITRTYQTTDACGNSASCTQTITVNDTTVPTINCPGPLAFQCFAQLPAPSTTSVSAFDNCGGPVTVTHLGDSASNGTSNCLNIITRTYQAVDGCGNSNTCIQTITVNDTTPPSISCPGPLAFQCFSQVPVPNVGSVTSTDNCGGLVTVTHAGDAASNGTSSCNNVITRTYQAVDTCGNSSTCIQTFTVNDTTVPTITCPGPAAFQCFAQVPAPSTTSVTASDNCGGLVTVTHLGDSPSNGTSNCFNIITRTYRAIDACGNSNTCIQTFTVNDTTPPSITCPAATAVQCFSQVPAPSTTAVTTSDNCGGAVTVIHVGDAATNGTSSCNNVITRTYQATDTCGNTASCTQTITVNDTTPPTITCPAATAVQCFALVPAATPGSLVTSDNCGGLVSVIHVGDSATNGTSNCNNVVTRTYQATDLCGNTATCTQTITVNDTTPPVITCPGAVGVQCFALVPAASTTSVTASDNCLGAVVVTHAGDVATNGTSSCNNVITRTYLATDTCGNTATCTQTITVNDTTAPTITCPAALAFQCFSQIPPANPLAVTTSDNCVGTVVVTHAGDAATNGTSSCNNVITRTYLATDPCGNTATCTQTITINDTTAPVITCPVDFTAVCGTPTDPGTTGTATATDNCNATPTITFTDVPSGGPCPLFNEVITRTWAANDGCNQASCVQIITLTPPPFISPGCLVDLGGGCGTPAPLLAGSLNGNDFQFLITNAAPNSPGFIGAQLGPVYGPLPPAVAPCVLHLNPAFPTTAVFGSIQTDAAGMWNAMFNVPNIPNPLNVKVQAVILPAVLPPGGFTLTNGVQMFRPCPPCTYTLALWATNVGPSYANFINHWATVFPAGMEMQVGIFDPVNGNAFPNGFRWLSSAQGKDAVHDFVNSTDGGGTNMPISIDLQNPTTTFGSGTICRMTAVLRMNVEFNAAGFLGAQTPGFGNLIYVNPASSLNGFTVSQILALCDQLLAGVAPPPPGYNFTNFTDLLEDLAASFTNCVPSPWASVFLHLPTP